MQRGFIKIHRQILIWEWADDHLTFSVFIRVLLKANWEDKDWRGVLVKRGSFISSVSKLAAEFKLSTQQIRTMLNRLQKTNEITIQTTNRFSIYTIVNYDLYQNSSEEITNKSNNKESKIQQANVLKLNNNLRSKELRNKESVDNSFNEFWALYPNKKAKGSAKKAWFKLNPDSHLIEKIHFSLNEAKKSEQWCKDNSKYIPHPATWLNSEGWEDEYSNHSPQQFQTYEEDQWEPQKEESLNSK